MIFLTSAQSQDSTVIEKKYNVGKVTQNIDLGFPKMTKSLCPECKKVIDAKEFIEDGKVYMEKTCPEHGYVKDIISSSADLTTKMETWTFEDGLGLTNPNTNRADKECPTSCGLCEQHTSHTSLANVDLTNRCNLKCPVCFANANATGMVYEPDFELVRKMLKTLRDERPTPCPVVQFSGGEPTLYPRFIDVLKMSKEMGFTHVQCATNGIRFANSLEFAKECRAAGLDTLYLQFDGCNDDCYTKTRGVPLWDKKQKTVENCRKADLKIVFVPTIVNGKNDDQVGPILDYAIDNIDVISGIAYQPICFTGRKSHEERQQERFTATDIAKRIEEQTGYTELLRDWYPLSFVSPFSKLVEALRGKPTITCTAHPHCTVGTYLFINRKTRSVTPITRFIDIEGFLTQTNELAKKTEKSFFKSLSAAKIWYNLRKYFIKENAPDDMTFDDYIKILEGLIDKGKGRGEKGSDKLPWNMLLVAGMHFQDSYNYDVNRVKRCVIHYSAPDGKLYPFCTYNSGPEYRFEVEKEFSMPMDEWKKQQRG